MIRRSPTEDGVATCFVREALSDVFDRQEVLDRVLRYSDIDRSVIGSPTARVSPLSYGRMWRALAKETGDEFFGLDSHRVRPGSFALACQCAVGAENLGQALRRICNFYACVLDDMVPRLEERPGRDFAVLEIETGSARPRLFAQGALFMIIIGAASWLIRRRIELSETRFAAPRPPESDTPEYETLFGPLIRYDAKAAAVCFDNAYLELQVVQDQTTLRGFLQGAPSNLLVKYRNPASLSFRVRRFLKSQPPCDWLDLAQVAKRFNLAERTLIRQLNAEGSSYQALKDSVREGMAVQMLADGGLAVHEVSAAIGFAEPSAFHKAFKKWTGCSPAQYRLEAQGRVVGTDT